MVNIYIGALVAGMSMNCCTMAQSLFDAHVSLPTSNPHMRTPTKLEAMGGVAGGKVTSSMTVGCWS